MSLRRGGLTGVIIVLWRALRNNKRAPMRTLIHCCVANATEQRKCQPAVAARGEIGREGCEISSLVAGPSPRFSSRGAKNQMEGQKTRRGPTFLKYSIGCMQQPEGQTWNRGHRFQMGGGRAPLAPRWRHPVWLNIWNCRPGCFYN